MATDDVKLSKYFEDIKISSIIALQALVRGFLVRKWFRQLRDVYVAAVSEIERVDNINVVWRETFSKPQVMKTSWRKQMTLDKLEPGNKDSRSTSSGGSTPHGVSPRSGSDINHPAVLNHNQLKSVQSMNTQTNTEHTAEQHGSMEAEDKDNMYCAVETQTTMLDTTPQHQNVVLYDMPYSNKNIDCAEKTNKDIDCAENLKGHEVNIPYNMTTVLQTNDLHLNLEIESTETDSDTENKQTETKYDSENKLSEEEGDHKTSDSQRSAQLQKQVRDATPGYSSPSDEGQNVDTSCRPQSYPHGVPARTLVSPLPRGRRVDRQEISTLTNVTSVWDSINSIRDSYQTADVAEKLPSDRDDLESLRKNIALELLWLQQAINSRKNYLLLKQQM